MRLSILRPKYGAALSQLGIESVNKGVLTLRSDNYVTIYETSSVNFELRSEAEQDTLLENFKSFLNSINYPLQIIVRIREIDLDSIQEFINQRMRQENSQVFRSQLTNYSDFIKSLVKDNRVLTRRFYVAISYKGDSKTDFDTAKEQLSIRADIMTKGLLRLGMNVKPLDDLSILNLFYSFYNPAASKNRPLSDELISALKPHIKKEV